MQAAGLRPSPRLRNSSNQQRRRRKRQRKRSGANDKNAERGRVSTLRSKKPILVSGGTHPQIGHALIAATAHAAILCSQLFNPVMTRCIVLGEGCLFLLGEQGGEQRGGLRHTLLTGGSFLLAA